MREAERLKRQHLAQAAIPGDQQTEKPAQAAICAWRRLRTLTGKTSVPRPPLPKFRHLNDPSPQICGIRKFGTKNRRTAIFALLAVKNVLVQHAAQDVAGASCSGA